MDQWEDVWQPWPHKLCFHCAGTRYVFRICRSASGPNLQAILWQLYDKIAGVRGRIWDSCSYHFCYTMQCVDMTFAMVMWVSCGLSSRCIMPKRMSQSSFDLRRIVAQPFHSHTEYQTWTPQVEGIDVSYGRGVSKSWKIWPINHSNSPEGRSWHHSVESCAS